MLYKFTFKDDDNQLLVANADSRDILHWEREKSGRSAAQLTTDWKVSDFYSLAHCAARRTGVYDGTLRQFEEAYRLLRTEEVVDDETGEVDEGGPFPAGQS